MGQRNFRTSNEMVNLEPDQQAQFHLYPELCVLSNYPQPNTVNPMLPVAERPVAGFVSHHLPGYSAVHQPHLAENPGVVLATTSNYYNPYIVPPGPSVFPPLTNQGSQFVDCVGGVFKRKSAQEYSGNFQYCNSTAGPSSAVPLTMEVGHLWSVRPGPVGGETILAHNPNNLVPGNYQGQIVIPANAAPWLEQQFHTNGGDGGHWTWSQAPAMSYIHGPGNMVAERYQEAAVHRSSTTNFHNPPPPVYRGHYPNPHHPPPSMQGGSFYSQVPGPSYRLPGNGAVNTPQDGVEVALGYVGPIRPTGLAIYHHSHGGRAVIPEATTEVAMFEGYHEMGNAVDHHRDLRLDVDNMSYEELLALEDHIGYVATGLSENSISSHLKTRLHVSSCTSMDMEDQEIDFCTICQTNYENQEKIGTLDCGHEYHADCVKKWLIIRNICPICKSSALKRKESSRDG